VVVVRNAPLEDRKSRLPSDWIASAIPGRHGSVVHGFGARINDPVTASTTPSDTVRRCT
jgi:hypothetical protein